MALRRAVQRDSRPDPAPAFQLVAATERHPVITLPAYVIADVVGRLLPATVLAGAAIEASLLYRLWHQMTGTTPSEWPGTWVYAFAGTLIGPFRRYDTVQLVPEAPVIDLAGLIALEFYLVATLALVGVTLICRVVSRPDADLAVATRMVWRASKRNASGAMRVYRYLDRQSWRLAEAIDAYFQSRDWPRYRRAIESGWRSVTLAATDAGRRAQLAAEEARRRTDQRGRLWAQQGRERWAPVYATLRESARTGRVWLFARVSRVIARAQVLMAPAPSAGVNGQKAAETMTRRQFLRLPSPRA